MRGIVGASPGPVEGRQRAAVNFDDASKRRHMRSRDFNDASKFILPFFERS